MPERLQLSRAKGWRMPENSVKVDRSTVWGNPFQVGKHGDAAYCVELYRLMIGGMVPISFGRGMYEDASAHSHFIRENIGQLRGKNLACWCKPGAPCHADVLLELANVEAG
jgi:hypothetical protein